MTYAGPGEVMYTRDDPQRSLSVIGSDALLYFRHFLSLLTMTMLFDRAEYLYVGMFRYLILGQLPAYIQLHSHLIAGRKSLIICTSHVLLEFKAIHQVQCGLVV